MGLTERQIKGRLKKVCRDRAIKENRMVYLFEIEKEYKEGLIKI